jgi:hypothetical protein
MRKNSVPSGCVTWWSLRDECHMLCVTAWCAVVSCNLLRWYIVLLPLPPPPTTTIWRYVTLPSYCHLLVMGHWDKLWIAGLCSSSSCHNHWRDIYPDHDNNNNTKIQASSPWKISPSQPSSNHFDTPQPGSHCNWKWEGLKQPIHTFPPSTISVSIKDTGAGLQGRSNVLKLSYACDLRNSQIQLHW